MSFQNFIAQQQDKSYTTNYHNSNGGTIVCEERASKYVYKYKSGETLLKLHVDGGLISDQNILKCDYLLLNYTTINEKTCYHSIFIELKGSDLTHACKQIWTTIENLGNDLKGSKLHARIVLSKVPKIDIQVNQLKESLMKKYQCLLYYQSRFMEEESDQDGYPSHSQHKGN
ncbi:MAG: hypothetical protein LBC20_06270 [Planctomycetaceae bacterium]|jgi:hypothetical protein|nr:hypothetical protein [Planctomycetaceae bacterium]